jgi:TonB family protein
VNLSHPHLLRILETGRCQLNDGHFSFVVTEFADENLSQILPSRALTPSETREMLAPLLQVLTFLHDQNLAHGRIKPANILAVRDQLKLSSDSIQKTAQVPDSDTPGPYDPPEKTKSSSGDVWALGVTLVEVLTQRRPVQTASGGLDVPESLPQPFLAIARECLRPDPQQRSTLAGVAAKLNQPSASAPGKPPEVFQWRLVVPVVVLLAGIAVLVARPEFNRKSADRKPAPPPVSQPSEAQPRSQPGPAPGDSSSASQTKPSPARPQPRDRSAGDRNAVESPQPSVQSGVVEQVLPNVSESARNTIEGTIRVSVRVHVDSSGKVVGAEFDSPGPSKYFARKAMEAAQKWKFSPASDPRDWVLRFGFRRTETKIYPAQVTR